MKQILHTTPSQDVNPIVKLETCFSEEQKHIWKNMIKIEKIKKQSEHQKNFLLHRTNRSANA